MSSRLRGHYYAVLAGEGSGLDTYSGKNSSANEKPTYDSYVDSVSVASYVRPARNGVSTEGGY